MAWIKRLNLRVSSLAITAGVFGSVLGFTLYYYMIKHLDARTSR